MTDQPILLKNGQPLVRLSEEQRRKQLPRFKYGDQVHVVETGKVITIWICDASYLPHSYGSTEIDPRYGEPTQYWDFELAPIETLCLT